MKKPGDAGDAGPPLTCARRAMGLVVSCDAARQTRLLPAEFHSQRPPSRALRPAKQLARQHMIVSRLALCRHEIVSQPILDRYQIRLVAICQLWFALALILASWLTRAVKCGVWQAQPSARSGAPGNRMEAATYVARVVIVSVGLNPDDVGNSDAPVPYRLPMSWNWPSGRHTLAAGSSPNRSVPIRWPVPGGSPLGAWAPNRAPAAPTMSIIFGT